VALARVALTLALAPAVAPAWAHAAGAHAAESAAESAAEPADASLCLAHEPVVFACSVEGKIASLCRSPDAGSGLSYRFGKRAAVELRYPQPGQRARPAFTVKTEPLIGGGVTKVAFQRGGYTYTVYSRVARAPDGGTPEFEDGITVERRGKLLRRLRCEDGGAGFREPPGQYVK